MTDVYNDYRRKSGAREDPRLARRDSKASNSSERPKQQYDKLGVPISPKPTSSSPSPTTDPRVRDHSSWQTHQPPAQNNQYTTTMQTAYQHLPPAMYADHGQYSTQGYNTTAYGNYQQNYVTTATGYNPYQGYTQTQGGYTTGTVQPGPPGEEYPQNEWAPAYPNLLHPPPSHQPQPVAQQISVEKHDDHKREAVAQELKQQKAQMSKQREEYVRKVGVLRRELELLRNQKQELLAEHSSEHENNHILRENSKLQIEIQNKMKTIYNVIEMLTNIIGDHLTISELEEMYREESPKQRREKNRRSLSTEKIDLDAKFCYIYYDPELHWCRICDVFPKSAKDYLLHLHSKEHRQVTQDRDMVDTPWHRLPSEPELPSFEGSTKKRMPIKGLQFLISSTAWYCKLCDTWVGDLHCASQHLKSQNHNQNYTNFVEQNPHWEIEWLRDRDKALVRTSKDRCSDSDDSDNRGNEKKSKKRKDRHSPSDSKKDKKKKKHVKKRRRHSSDSSSSSSSSDSSSEDESNDKSKSIRVAMRNKMKLQAQMILNEDLGGKWEVLGRLVEEHKRKEAADMGKESGSEDNLINQWMTINEPQEKDKRLFDNLKDRMKLKQEAEKARLAEVEQKKQEKEKQEQELREKKEKEALEAREKEEERRRQQEEMDRQKEKEREQIRFKTRDKYRRRSASASPERNRSRYSRSPSNEHRRRERSPDRYRRDSRYNENGRRSSDGRKNSPSYEGRDSPSGKRKSYKHDDKESDSRDSNSNKKDRKMQMSHKKPHFIGRMPLFKNKKNEDKVEKEIKKEDYDIPRQSRFQPGNLARAFIPEPEVVCFPKLSSIPPLMIPPPPCVVQAPDPPKISQVKLKAPPPPIINSKEKKSIQTAVEIQEDMEIEDQHVPLPPPPPMMPVKETPPPPQREPQQNKLLPRDFQDALNLIYPDPSQVGMDPATMMQYQYNMDYNSMMYSQMYDYSQEVPAENVAPPPPDLVTVEHTMPLPPPPLPPDDPNEDLAMLGISADDMAAQMF